MHSSSKIAIFFVVVLAIGWSIQAKGQPLSVLKSQAFAHYVEHFNTMEDENVTNYVSNADSWDWLRANIPLFECPDSQVEETYYFRWWSFRKHLAQTTNGFIFTEFLTPVRFAGRNNSLSSAAGFHVAEARWLKEPKYLDDYMRFWLQGNGGQRQSNFHNFSGWFAQATYDRYLVTQDKTFTTNLLDSLIADYQAWESERRLTNGLFWQFDVRDAMEESISGSRTKKNIRPTINSYMYGNARAIASIGRLAHRGDVSQDYDAKANELRRLVQASMWDNEAKFFKVKLESGELSDAREEIGFIPWFFDLPEKNINHEGAWPQIIDSQGFKAPYGITTAERRHPLFRSHGCYKCEWDGAVWPYATSQTLYAMANYIRDYSQKELKAQDYFAAFLDYARSQQVNGKPYIGEYLDEVTGQWYDGRDGRSRYYNHSTFADLIITGLVGLRPHADSVVEINPLLPPGAWNWFCLDGLNYHGHVLTILWDKTGRHYGRGAGLQVLADGKLIAKAEQLERVTGKLP